MEGLCCAWLFFVALLHGSFSLQKRVFTASHVAHTALFLALVVTWCMVGVKAHTGGDSGAIPLVCDIQ